MQEDEIEACLGMPVDEFLGTGPVGQFSRDMVRAALESTGIVPSPIEGFGNPTTHEFFMPPLDGSYLNLT